MLVKFYCQLPIWKESIIVWTVGSRISYFSGSREKACHNACFPLEPQWT
jgi:hypothetical protein